MNQLPAFACYHCHQKTGNPHTSLDRRTVRRIAVEGQITLEILEDLELFTYCAMDCWHGHEPIVAMQLALKTRYPTDGEVIPCSRCGSPVTRATPHLAYTVTTMLLKEGADAYLGEVLHEAEFAVLCVKCEEPETILVNRAHADIEE